MSDTPAADEQLRAYRILTESPGRDLQALVDVAAMVCDVPTAAINLITSQSQHQVATAGGIDPSVCAREHSMCAAVIEDTDVVVSPDAREDDRFAANPFVTGTLGRVRFYASAPLTTPAGVTIGRLCVFDEVVHVLADEKAEVLAGLASRIVDVLELRLRTRQLEEAQDELRRSNDLLSHFAGQVSHDLRQPLTAILANAELLSTEPVVAADPEATRLTQAALAAGGRMSRLIDTILAYARAGSRLDLRDVALDALIEEIRHDLEPVLAQRAVMLVVDDLPTVRADRQQLYAVLQNLIANAIKFAPAGSEPRVTISARRDGGAWRITVADNGPGIPADRRNSVFELYSRADRSVAGSGIGLATVQRAVRAHGGEVGIDDAPGGGAALWFTLPT